MRRLKEKISQYGIGVRMAVCFIGLVILPFILLAFIMFYSFQNYTVNNLSATTRDTMSAIKSEIDVLLEQYESMTMTLYYGGYVERLEGMEEGDRDAGLSGVLDGISFPDTHIHAIYLRSGDQVYHSGATYDEIFDVMAPHEQEILDAGGKCIWYPTDEMRGSADQKMYILARRLNGRDFESVRIMYMVLDEKFISEVYSQLTGGYAEKYLTDGSGNILYSAGDKKEGKIDLSGIPASKRSGAQEVDTDEGGAVYAYSKLRSADWYCISTVPDFEIIRDILTLELPFIVISVIYLLFLAVMLYMMKKSVFRPLHSLKKAMDDYAELRPVELEPMGSGEFRSLAEHFSDMTERISQLMIQYKEEQEEKNRQRMMALTAQLTPHFIYNALNTIKWMAVLNKQKNIQHLIESLIYIFRNAARVDDESYTVRDELKLVENYAVIQKARFMNFELKTEADEDCMEYHIRKFLLQPVVENAIVHGLGRGQEKDGEIRIRIWKEEDGLYITVSDTGVGFDVEEWRKHPDTGEDHTNIGLHNVEEIIRLEYGPPYSLEIQSKLGSGTTVTYHLPLISG